MCSSPSEEYIQEKREILDTKDTSPRSMIDPTFEEVNRPVEMEPVKSIPPQSKDHVAEADSSSTEQYRNPQEPVPAIGDHPPLPPKGGHLKSNWPSKEENPRSKNGPKIEIQAVDGQPPGAGEGTSKIHLPESLFIDKTKGAKTQPVLINMADVEPEEVQWLWQGRIPMGKLSLLVGDPGLGKSFLTIYIISQVTTGQPWPDKSDDNISVGSAIIMTAEDGLGDTVRPRLDAAGADVSKVVALEGFTESEKIEHCILDLRKNIAVIEETIRSISDVCLVVIDPISAYMGKADGNSNTEVRSILTPLATLAKHYGLAVLAVSHLNKDTKASIIHRTSGSVAFTAAARSVWMVTKDKDDPTKRLFLPVKANLAPEPTGMRYKIIDQRVEFDSDTFQLDEIYIEDTPALELPTDVKPTAVDKAAKFLQEILVDGSVESAKILEMAEKEGISEKTLRRAQKALGIQAFNKGYGKNKKWFRQLPGSFDGQKDLDGHDSGGGGEDHQREESDYDEHS